MAQGAPPVFVFAPPVQRSSSPAPKAPIQDSQNLSSSKANSFAPPVVVNARAAQRSGTPNYAEQQLDLIHSNHEVTVGKALAGTRSEERSVGKECVST